MHITARVRSQPTSHSVEVWTAHSARSLAVPPRPNGRGSAANGGEFLMLALATCYGDDLYREADRAGHGRSMNLATAGMKTCVRATP